MGILHVENKKIKKKTNTRWLIDAKAHQVLALNVSGYITTDRAKQKVHIFADTKN